MALVSEILELLSGLTDPRMRIDIISTIKFLGEMFMFGRISEEQLRAELRQICLDVITYCNPNITEDEAKLKAEEFTERMVKEIKVESVSRRMMSRIGL